MAGIEPDSSWARETGIGHLDQPAVSVAIEPASDQQNQGKPLSIEDHEAALGSELKAKGVSDIDIKVYIASARKQLCGEVSCVQEFSYPFLLQSRDGVLHLVYTWNRSRIKYARFNPLDFPAVAVNANGSN